MPRFTRIHANDFTTPPIEQPQAFDAIADFVGEIIRPSAIGIDVIEILMEFFREQETDDVKIFVVMRGQPARVFFRFAVSPLTRHSRRIGHKIARQRVRHGMIAVLNAVPPSARRNMTLEKFSSGSSASTKSQARMPPLEMMSSASCMEVGV